MRQASDSGLVRRATERYGLDPALPEIVIYEPLPNGRRRSVGADYLVFAKDWHDRNGGSTPELFE